MTTDRKPWELTAIINGYEEPGTVALNVSTEPIDVTPAMIVKPDPEWETTDASGHFHAFSESKEDPLPTLDRKTRMIEYGDPEEEVWDEIEEWWECRLCGERVEPKWIRTPTVSRELAPGRKSWIVTLSRPWDNRLPARHTGEPVSVRVLTEHREYFGVGMITNSRSTGLNSGQSVTIVGTSSLGQRKR